jgi:hypothetical protein
MSVHTAAIPSNGGSEVGAAKHLEPFVDDVAAHPDHVARIDASDGKPAIAAQPVQLGHCHVRGQRQTAWAAVLNGDDNVWISKTGEQISPGGYVGGGLQMVADLAVGPAGDVWLMNDWQALDSCFGAPPDQPSTFCGGRASRSSLAWPHRSTPPQIGPARAR